MNADERRFKHQELTRRIIGVFFEVYNELGFGFLESVYREAMAIALRAEGLRVDKEFGLKARFRGQVIGEFRVDLLVNGSVLIELKATRSIIGRVFLRNVIITRTSAICVDLRYLRLFRPQLPGLSDRTRLGQRAHCGKPEYHLG